MPSPPELRKENESSKGQKIGQKGANRQALGKEYLRVPPSGI